MITGLFSDAALRERFHQDCTAHARTVSEVLAAHAVADLDDMLALRSCALELHSLKGVASVLGLSAVIDTMGLLSEIMVRRDAVPTEAFWESFRTWFADMVSQVFACTHGKVDTSALSQLKAQREQLVAALGQAPVSAADPSKHTPRPLSPSAGRRLLLIDDSATVRAALAARLLDRGYPVRTARSMTEAARVLAEFDPEIVVTDVCMPHVEGDELCRRIKAHMKRLVPVLLYSSLPEDQLAERARRAGADGYLCKIRGVEALIERLDELLAEEVLF